MQLTHVSLCMLSNVYTSCVGLVKVRGTVETFRNNAKFSAVVSSPVCCGLGKTRFIRTMIVLTPKRVRSCWLRRPQTKHLNTPNTLFIFIFYQEQFYRGRSNTDAICSLPLLQKYLLWQISTIKCF